MLCSYETKACSRLAIYQNHLCRSPFPNSVSCSFLFIYSLLNFADLRSTENNFGPRSFFYHWQIRDALYCFHASGRTLAPTSFGSFPCVDRCITLYHSRAKAHFTSKHIFSAQWYIEYISVQDREGRLDACFRRLSIDSLSYRWIMLAA